MTDEGQAGVNINATDNTPSAFQQALDSMKKWSAATKTQLDEVKKATYGIKEGFELAHQVMNGFGAVTFAKDLERMAEGAFNAARGMGQFVLDAGAAGSEIDADTTRAARELVEAMDDLARAAKEVGVAVLGPFLEPIKEGAEGLANFCREARPTVEWIMEMGKQAALHTPAVAGFIALWSATKNRKGWIKEIAEDWGEGAGDAPVEAGDKLFRRQGMAQRRIETRQKSDKDFWGEAFGTEGETDGGFSAGDLATIDKDRAKLQAEKDGENAKHVAKMERERLQREAEMRETELFYDHIADAEAKAAADQAAAAAKANAKRLADQKKANADELKLKRDLHVSSLQAQQAMYGGLESLANAAGLKSHAAQKAFSVGQAVLAFNVAKAKAMAEGGPLAGPALIGAVIGMMVPIISAIKGSDAGGGSTGGGGGVPSVPDYSSSGGGYGTGISQPAPISTPAVPAPATINAYFTFTGPTLDADGVVATLTPSIQDAFADGRLKLGKVSRS